VLLPLPKVKVIKAVVVVEEEDQGEVIDTNLLLEYRALFNQSSMQSLLEFLALLFSLALALAQSHKE
jgi:hypothetical protein